MANAGTVLNLHFKDAGDEPMTIRFPYADPSVADVDVKDLADAIITNGDMWDQTPTEKISADLVTTAVKDIDIAD